MKNIEQLVSEILAARSSEDVEEILARDVSPWRDEIRGPLLASLGQREDGAARWAIVLLADLMHVDVSEIIPPAEIVTAAMQYLLRRDDLGSGWGWYVLSFGEMSDEVRWQLVMQLAEQAPNDDNVLWLVGDGPVAALEMLPGGMEKLRALEKSNPRLARIHQLVVEDLEVDP